ncbi:MAG: DinB family protein [Chloroflexota bacterium]
MKKMLMTLYEYNYWATERILAQTAVLPSNLFTMQPAYSLNSLRDTLVHTMAAEWIWRMRTQEQEWPTELLDPAEFPTLETVEARWETEQQKMWGFLTSLRKKDLKRVVHYRSTEGQELANVLGHILHHVVLHGMQHRAESAAILTEFGYSPGDIDFIVYLRNQ